MRLGFVSAILPESNSSLEAEENSLHRFLDLNADDVASAIASSHDPARAAQCYILNLLTKIAEIATIGDDHLKVCWDRESSTEAADS